MLFLLHLFQLIAPFNSNFSCCNSFVISSIDKVTTETKRFVSVITNVATWFGAAVDITKFSGQVRMRLVLQLINGIVRVLQKLLKYLNGTIISTFFVPSSSAEPVIFCLNLNKTLLPGKLAGVP